MRRLLTILILAAPATTLAATGWNVEKSADPLTDQSVATAMSTYSVGLTKRIAVVRCRGTTLDVYFDFGEFLNNDVVPVRYRLDKMPLIANSWSPSAEGTAVFADEDAEIARLLMRGDSFIIEAQDYRGQSHRSTFSLAAAPAAIQPVLTLCGLSVAGMSEEIVGLHKEVALELERWGSKNISVNKKILASLGEYSGPQNSTIEPEFALAVQRFYEGYIADCKDGKESGLMCDVHRHTWEPGSTPQMPPIGSVIYEHAPTDLKDEAGKLNMGE